MLCTDLDWTLFYILVLGTYSKFARENTILALGVCFPQTSTSAGRMFAASRSRLHYCQPNLSFPQQAKYTVRVSKLLLRNCVHAHDNCLEVLSHIIYLSTRRLRTIESPGHVTPSVFEILYFQEFCLLRPRRFFQKSTKNHHFFFAGPSSRGCAPPTHQGRC